MFMAGTSWIVLSRWVRRWLTLRLYSSKVIHVDGEPFLIESLTFGNKAIIFALHLFILGALGGGILGAFLGFVRLVYG
jgi:hypothetical protein